jgi:hypothetical protein
MPSELSIGLGVTVNVEGLQAAAGRELLDLAVGGLEGALQLACYLDAFFKALEGLVQP